jgi:hypothetical protein
MVNWTENRLNRLQLLRKEGVSATVIARKLGPAFSKGIVLRKLRELEAERVHRAEARVARKAAKERELKAAMRAAAKAARSSRASRAPVDERPARKARPVSPPVAEGPTIRVAPPPAAEQKRTPKLVAAAGPTESSANERPLKLVSVTVSTPERPSSGVRLFDLRATQCRWPLDDHRPARLFCGSATVGTSSWCEHHQRIAFTGFGKAAKTGSAQA